MMKFLQYLWLISIREMLDQKSQSTSKVKRSKGGMKVVDLAMKIKLMHQAKTIRLKQSPPKTFLLTQAETDGGGVGIANFGRAKDGGGSMSTN